MHAIHYLIFVKSKLLGPPFSDIRVGEVNPRGTAWPTPSLVHTSLVRLLNIKPLGIGLLVDTIVAIPFNVRINNGHHLDKNNYALFYCG